MRRSTGPPWEPRGSSVGSRLDNLVQIAHNVTVGEDTVIAALSGISGSTTIGDRVTLAGQVGVADHVEIGDDVTVGAQAGVINDIPPGMVLWGTPAVPHLEFKRGVVAVNRIPRLLKTLQQMEARLTALEDALGERETKMVVLSRRRMGDLG